VRGVGVAAARGGEHLLLGRGDAGTGLPRALLALQVRHERRVDVVVLHRPDEDGAHQAAVLAAAVHGLVGGPGPQDVLVDAGRLVLGAGAGEEVVVGLGLPQAEAGARPGAAGAALLTVDAVVGAELLLEVEGPVAALLVVVPDHVVGTGDDTAGTTGAQVGVDDLGLQFLPLGGPAGGCGGFELLLQRHGPNPTAPPAGGTSSGPRPSACG